MNNIDEIEIKLTFERNIEDGGDINEAGKDHLEQTNVEISGSQEISVPLHHFIQDEIGLSPADYNIGHFKVISEWEE